MVSNLDIEAVVRHTRPNWRAHVKKRPFHVISLRTQGSCVFYTQDARLQVDRQSLLIIPQNCAYCSETSGEEIIAIHFHGAIPYRQLTTVACSETQRCLIQDIHEFHKKGDAYSLCMAHSKLYALWGEIIEHENTGNGKDAISQGYAIIRMKYTDASVKIEALANSLSISSVYFRREFKKRYSITPKEYLIKLRLEHAALLLRNHYCNVSEASCQSGFDNPNYFSVAFKSWYGMSPSAYARNQHGDDANASSQ